MCRASSVTRMMPELDRACVKSIKNVKQLLVTPSRQAERDWAKAADAIRQKVCCEMGTDLLALFEAWDKDGDGRITREEFADAIIAIGITEVRDEALAAFDRFDADNSGELTLTELKVQIDIGRQAFGANGAIGANGLESTMSFASKEMGTLSTCEKLGHAFIIVSILLLPLFGIYINLGVDLMELINGTEDGRRLIAEEYIDSVECHAAWGQLLVIPVIASLASWICARHLDARISRDRQCVRKLFSMRTLIIWAVVIEMQCYTAALTATLYDFNGIVHYYFRLSFALLFLCCSLIGLEVADRTIYAFKTSEDEAMLKCQLQRTQLAMMKGFTRFNKAAEDATYGFAESQSAADVLYRMWSLLRVIAKCSLLVLMYAFYKSSAFYINIDTRFLDFEWPEILFFIMLAATAVISWAGCEGGALRNVMHLTFAKPFLLGDIVHIHDSGKPGGIGASIAGFVENITFSHVVIRSFDLKQVWLTHSEFQSLTVSNWTRRPNKCVSQLVTVRSTDSPEAVKSLLKFIKSWVDASADVKQSGYKKVGLSNIDPGYEITIIFFTAVGSSKKKMREKLLFDIMEAARRLGLTLVPNGLPVYQSGQVGSASGRTVDPSLSDLLPKAKKGSVPGHVDDKAKKTDVAEGDAKGNAEPGVALAEGEVDVKV